MSGRSYSRWVAGTLLAGLASAAVLSAGSAVAGVTGLHVGGAPLAGATIATDATVTLNAPGVASVSWVLDGSYVGRDTTAPFDLSLRTSAGSHKLKARSETSAGVKTTYEVRFTTSTATGPVSIPTAPAEQPVPAPSPAPTAQPVPVPSTSSPNPAANVRTVRTSTELTSALGSARPGQVIQLADGTYAGRFLIKVSGTASAPVVLRGSSRAILNGGSTSSGYTLHLSGASNWRLEGFSVRGGQKGVVLDRSNANVLSRLDVGSMGMEAVHFRTGSSDNRLENSSIHHTGLYEPGYGEGVYIGSATSNWAKYGNGGPDRSDRNVLAGNRIWATTAENVDVKEGTTGGVISGNYFDGAGLSGTHFADSWLDLKGNDYRVVKNTGVNTLLDGFQTHVQLDGWGRGNVFAENLLTVNAGGYGINIYKGAALGNVVACSNTVTGARLGMSNLRCS